FSISLHYPVYRRVLHSFPTRRSSDLSSESGTSLLGASGNPPRTAVGGTRTTTTLQLDERALTPLSLPNATGYSWSRPLLDGHGGDRKSTRLNSSHRTISYAVFCLKKK